MSILCTGSRPVGQSLLWSELGRSLTEEEIGQLVEAVAGSRYDAPVRITLSTGLRQAELLELTWAEVDLEQAVINVRGTKTANSRRQVELSGGMVKLLRAHRQDHSTRFSNTSGP